ncbi:ATP-dependent bile acid permease [Mycena sanguinolenta]|uniref:ATP-dependent bile acid permease n=1 Tax=Mycena sanguinolenta TaxID=230812 RepID=A0A8H6XTR2_9AGAR|nr:ATP-dependent bile acid permease [Mycena sanguinolenta]
MVPLCPSSEPNSFAFNDPCIRAAWSALLPAVLVFLLCLASIPVPTLVKKHLFNPVQDFLTLEEAEALSGALPYNEAVDSQPGGSKWTATVLASLGLVQILLWIGVGVTEVAFGTLGIGKILPFLFAVPWCYAFLRPLVKNSIITAPMDLFWLFFLEFAGAVLLLGGVLLGFGTVPRNTITFFVGNMILTTCLLVVVLRLPLGVPIRKPLPDELQPAPEDYTSLFSWITFAWVYPLIRRGANDMLAEKDVWDLSPTMQARPVFDKFTQLKRSSLLRSIIRAHFSDFLLDASLSVLSVFLNFSGPFFMNLILATLEHPVEGGRRLAYLYALLAFACQIAKSESNAMHFFYARRASTRMKTELMVAIYEKALKRCDFTGIVDAEAQAEAKATKTAKAGKKDGKTDTAAVKQDNETLGPKAGAQLGKIVNLMSVDTTTVVAIPIQMFYLYSAPFEIAISVVFLYRLLGWASFSGIVFVVLLMPLNYFIAKLNVKYEKGIVNARDKRTNVVNELISSIKFIKFGGAEERWLKKVNDARDVELSWLWKSRFMQLTFYLTWMLLPISISVSAFYVYIKQGNDLTVATAFTALSIFNMLNLPLSIVPFMISELLQAGVALSRISKFLEEDEVSDGVSALKLQPAEDDSVSSGLVIENGSFKWNELAEDDHTKPPEAETSIEETRFELRDISVSFPEGKLTCVVGPTASGKTALLQALLGEMTCLPGTQIKPPKSAKVDENGLMHCMSYSAQTPWLQMFWRPALSLPDLAILPDGDRTEIGVRGVTLSGGQKARVALARAVYAWTKYVLLDDPLSAVDSHTSRILFEKLFCGPLLKDRTVVLVTHHIDLLLSGNEDSGAHYIVRMLDGRIDAQGTVQHLRAQGLLEAIKHDLKNESPPEASVAEENEDKAEAKPASSQPVTKLVEEEEQAKGDVEWRIYKTYFQASGYSIWGIIGILITAVELVELGQKFWMKAWLIWGEAYQATSVLEYLSSVSFQGVHQTVLNSLPTSTPFAPAFDFPSPYDHPMFYVGIYTLIGLGSAFLRIAIDGVQLYGALRASRSLFRELLSKLAYSTFRWFDATPKGRILNRVGKDISTVDTSLSQSMYNLIQTLASLGAAILTVGVVFPSFLIPGLLLSFAYYKLSVGYLHSSRDLRRMEANTRSPIFTGFSELLEGIVTVRAFGVEKRFLQSMYGMVDRTTRLGYSFWQANRWLLLNFDYLGATAVLFTSLLSVSAFVPAGLAGICITSAMTFSHMSYFACRFYTNLQVDLNAVERVVNYLEIPQEPPAVIESNRPPAYWPSSSSNTDLLVVEDLEVKYAPNLPSVLHRISFALRARERVGILGRTGSGKSTLATSLLRFVEPTNGRIIVDGIDISTIGLNDLRTRLTFIPQDATLFSGTIRENLDPFNEYEEAELEAVLYRVHLHQNQSAHPSRRTSARGSPVAELEADTEAASVSGVSSVTEVDSKPVISLDSMVSTEGTNFSHGQRQLIALARALLRQSSIIILDEATSSIDFETDRKIQKTIREEFTDSLLVTIAHRINSVIDYDRLIILDQGKIAQFDTPYNLIQSEGIFRDMCKKTGAFSELEAAAKGASQRL